MIVLIAIILLFIMLVFSFCVSVMYVIDKLRRR